MPKKTFYNLPPEKKKKIERVALEEFAAKDYRDVHVTTIIRRADIADGSFYQYFENKKDLFMHLMKTIKKEKISFMLSRIGEGFTRDEGFFSTVKTVIFTGMLFGLERPLHMRFYDRMLESPLKDAAIEEVKQAALDYWHDLIVHGIAVGELREDIPAAFISRALAAASIELSRYVVDESNLRELSLKQTQNGNDLLEQAVERFAEQFIGLFGDGLKKNNNQPI